MPKRLVVKRSVNLPDGRKTSVSLEDAFWQGLKEITAVQNKRVPDVIRSIVENQSTNNLSSEIRMFVLGHYRRAVAELSKPVRFPGLSEGAVSE